MSLGHLFLNYFQAKVRLYLPHNFDERKKYPLLINVYGGPNSQQINDRQVPLASSSHTSTYHCKEDRQNAQEILIAGHIKLIIYSFDARYFEIISLNPRKIWQP